MNKTQNVCFCIQVPRQSDFIVYFKTGSFIVASNKQMVDLTYLRFVFLNDRSDAWWEMQWAACQGRDNSRGRAYRSCIRLVPSLCFLRLAFKKYFTRYHRVLRAQLFPSLLPLNYRPHADRRAADGETRCVHHNARFGDGADEEEPGPFRVGSFLYLFIQ